ncbi:hypothetical protein Ddc_05195 [Ditylenchus destructor]|nr:hypothetical protein Ddc_05195 [Ditylenchus destructor]
MPLLPELLALTSSAAFAGGAMMVSVVEHPARSKIVSNADLLTEWKESYAQAAPMQAGLALLSTAFGTYAAYQHYVAEHPIYPAFGVGAALIFANWPYTLLGIMPVNNQLNNTKVATEETRSLVNHWAKLHSVRTILGVASVGVYVWAILNSRKRTLF